MLPIGMDVVISLISVLLLLVVSAAVSASEVAMFSLSPTHLRDIKERGGRPGQNVLELLTKPRKLLATILIANNLVNVGIVILSTFVVASTLDLSRMPAYAVFLVQVISVTFVLLLVGEVVPKVYATSNPMTVSLRMAQ